MVIDVLFHAAVTFGSVAIDVPFREEYFRYSLVISKSGIPSKYGRS